MTGCSEDPGTISNDEDRVSRRGYRGPTHDRQTFEGTQKVPGSGRGGTRYRLSEVFRNPRWLK